LLYHFTGNILTLFLNDVYFSTAMEVSKDNSFGVLLNGTWSGIRGQLQRGVISNLGYQKVYF